jgi:DNA mismatch repair ATPase MutS
LTLLAAANAAVAAVRKGCELYKEIKSVAGEAKDVIDDLKQQYERIVDPTPAQKQQLHTEIQRVQEVAKSDPNDVYTEIGEQLGKLMDAYDALSKALLAEQMESKKVYRGEESVGRRALRRIIITTRLTPCWRRYAKPWCLRARQSWARCGVSSPRCGRPSSRSRKRRTQKSLN